MQALHLIFHFLVATVRKFKEEIGEISFDNIFSFTQFVQNIKMSTFNQCKKLLTKYFTFFEILVYITLRAYLSSN